MLTPSLPSDAATQARFALALRLGLGSVFIIGGFAKLERLLTPSKAQGIVDQYMGPLGYINQTFQEWLFSGSLPDFVTPWSFLTILSAFELISGLLLVVGLMVRPLSLIWALLLWSFVFSLPVVTTPAVAPPSATYTSPALLVQVRDVALSGLFFVLYNLGVGTKSLDAHYFASPIALGRAWDPLGLLLRLSLAVVFLVGGFFHGFDKITTFGVPAWLLVLIGIGLVAGRGVRIFAVAAAAILIWYLVAKVAGASDLIGYFNAVKRELALLAATGVLAYAGGGHLFTIDKAWDALRDGLRRYSSVTITEGNRRAG